MTIFTVFFQMLALLLMIGAGWLAAKTGMLDARTNSQMSRMILNIFNPMLMLSSAANSVGLIPRALMGRIALIAAGMFLLFILVGMVLSPLFEKDLMQRKVYQLMFVFSNLGFIGIPVVSSILGAEYVVYVTEFVLVYSFVFYTYGVALMDGSFSLGSLKAMVNPGNVCGLLALAVVLLELRLPDFLLTAVTYLGNVTSPMALMAVGFTLANANLRRIFCSGKLYVFAAVKLVALPLLMLPLLRLVTDDSALQAVCMVMFGMPVANMPLMLGTQKGIDCTNCSAAIILTTLLCVATIPLLLSFVL